ncbi:MAG: tRNA 2-selenouridine(34) synthase MnmH [Spirochaeta sp.]|nr:tRNA 2-selenouridine(34) synthase MnmH [Spirochaeta sp.]RPG07406.1 MAG: tRNA 2-selenouridine(34) synthase MnmH [Proteobacteria bacterium TMED72]
MAVSVTSDPIPASVSPGPARIAPADVFPLGGKEPAFQLLDVRAPVEVHRSGIPGAVSLPILNDEERHAIGQCYHAHGNAAAVALGVELTTPYREARVAAWREAVAACERPTAFACWRGGQRSGIATEWLGDPNVSRVQGGTKALRQYLMAGLESQFEQTETLVISGLTGCGKTDFLHRLQEVVEPGVLALDLEGLANHRGSAFGGFPAGQPAQQTFENKLAATVHLEAPRMILVEDEARFVGHVEVPTTIFNRVQGSPIIILETPQEERVARIVREYVFEPTERSSREAVRQDLEKNLNKLAKRLGGTHLKECLKALALADREDEWFSIDAHVPWVDGLLRHYYDKLYKRAVTRMNRPIAFQGSAEDGIAWFAERRLATTQDT